MGISRLPPARHNLRRQRRCRVRGAVFLHRGGLGARLRALVRAVFLQCRWQCRDAGRVGDALYAVRFPHGAAARAAVGYEKPHIRVFHGGAARRQPHGHRPVTFAVYVHVVGDKQPPRRGVCVHHLPQRQPSCALCRRARDDGRGVWVLSGVCRAHRARFCAHAHSAPSARGGYTGGAYHHRAVHHCQRHWRGALLCHIEAGAFALGRGGERPRGRVLACGDLRLSWRDPAGRLPLLLRVFWRQHISSQALCGSACRAGAGGARAAGVARRA